MKFKVLIVEDEDPVGDLLEEEVTKRLHSLNHQLIVQRCKSLPQSGNALEEFRPHIVTLDLRDESTDDITAGKPAWEFIRDTHFCPVVFFSANALPEGFPSGTDPFACYLNKNEKKAKDVATTIESFIPHVLGLENIRAEVERKYARSLQKVSTLIWKSESDPEKRSQAMLRVTRRRLAATLEHPLNEETTIKAWEQFIYPPVEDDLCTGDVVVQKYGNRLNPDSFRVVLTPPCDLVTAPGRTPVKNVLLGKCIPVNDPEILRVCSLVHSQRLPAQLGKKLQGDKLDSKLVLPKMADLWPAMVLDFKCLELVERKSIALSVPTTSDYNFERLASMDSPFREALSWRFTHSVGRPGYPAIDQDSLAADVEEAALRRP